MRRGIIVLAVVAFALPALGSQPGHPLDWSDVQFYEPGLSCAKFPEGLVEGGLQFDFDNEAQILSVGYSVQEQINGCGNIELNRWPLVRAWDGNAWHTLVYVEERCVLPDEIADIFTTSGALVRFEPTLGYVIINSVRSTCLSRRGQCSYPPLTWIPKISGFPTLFDILQTYTPTADALQFRVPAHPEGLRSADHFDTYWGHVSDLPDFTQAQPMQCHYPATPPSIGDYLSVTDTSPAPPPGSANYTVTAVTNGTQRRYGRKLFNAVMSGRDPAMLPACP